MLLDVFYAMLHDDGVLLIVACVARLQIQVVGLQMAAVHRMLVVENEFQFVGMRDDDSRLSLYKGLLWRTGYPVYSLWQQMRSVGLHSHIVTSLMPCLNEGVVGLQRGLTSCQHDKPTFTSRA